MRQSFQMVFKQIFFHLRPTGQWRQLLPNLMVPGTKPPPHIWGNFVAITRQVKRFVFGYV